MTKSAFLTFLDNTLVILWGIFFLLFPFLITTATTDAFILPKEIAFVAVVLVSLTLWGVKVVLTEKVTLRRTPFDLPVLLFLFALLLSSLFALNRANSLIATIPVILIGLSVFILTNVLKRERAVVFVLSALLTGGAVTAIFAVFSYFRIYPLLFSFTHIPSFTPLGSLIEQAFFFVCLLPISLFFASPLFKGKTNNKTVSFSIVTFFLAAGLLVTLLQLFTTQKPILLPFETGFQTAFAAISQDTGRIAQGFLLGSGFGTFADVFTRFKQASFNTSPFWANQFTQSSSFLLELLATGGILGMLSFLFLVFRLIQHPKIKKGNPVYFGVALLTAISLIFPFSFIEIALFFALVGLFAAAEGIQNTKEYYDVELKFVALKKGMITFQQIAIPSHEKREYNKPTAIIVGLFFAVVVILAGWMGIRFVLSDMVFQESLVLAQSNNGTATYKYQAQAITTFPYRSVYYRIFSQTNIALANSLATVSSNGSPSAATQSTLYALIQQGITTAKQATTLSPLTTAEWQNLSSVYRALIGLGQNADSFAISAIQQAIILDPTNPQEFVALGGLYYQLGQWDNAIRAFQQAVSLKQDYANAYYNLGHAYEQKGDYTDALTSYQAVQQLVAQDKTSETKIASDIATLQSKIGQQNKPVPTPTPVKPAATVQAQPTQTPLKLSGETASPTPTQSPTPGQ